MTLTAATAQIALIINTAGSYKEAIARFNALANGGKPDHV